MGVTKAMRCLANGVMVVMVVIVVRVDLGAKATIAPWGGRSGKMKL